MANKQIYKLRNISPVTKIFMHDNESFKVNPNEEIEVPFERIPDGCERVNVENTKVADAKKQAAEAKAEAKRQEIAKNGGVATSKSVNLPGKEESALGVL